MKVTLPKEIPEANFSRSMLDTPQRYPRAGSQSYPSPADEPNADGSTTVYFGPTQPAGIKRGNWIQTTPGKGWFTILRLYSPLEPFFAKMWRPSGLAAVNAELCASTAHAAGARVRLPLPDVPEGIRSAVHGVRECQARRPALDAREPVDLRELEQLLQCLRHSAGHITG
jgi:Protein of unknown function (DUF1214)